MGRRGSATGRGGLTAARPRARTGAPVPEHPWRTGALLALTSAVLHGLVDLVGFRGGTLSRRVHVTTVTLLGRTGGLPLAAAATVLPSPAGLREARHPQVAE